jgi:hypothetical protein
MNPGKDDNRPPPVPDKYRRERISPGWTRNSDLEKIRDGIEQVNSSLDEIKQATFAGEYRFDRHAINLAEWIEEILGSKDLARIQVTVPRWNHEALVHFFGEREVEWMKEENSLMLEFITTETEGLCFFDYGKFPDYINWEDDDVPELMAKRTAHWLNRSLVLNLGEGLDELVKA